MVSLLGITFFKTATFSRHSRRALRIGPDAIIAPPGISTFKVELFCEASVTVCINACGFSLATIPWLGCMRTSFSRPTVHKHPANQGRDLLGAAIDRRPGDYRVC